MKSLVMKNKNKEKIPIGLTQACKMLSVGMDIRIPKNTDYDMLASYVNSTYGYKLIKVTESKATRVS